LRSWGAEVAPARERVREGSRRARLLQQEKLQVSRCIAMNGERFTARRLL
jgi:hypothetical protein